VIRFADREAGIEAADEVRDVGIVIDDAGDRRESLRS
jgi:hypothetical protein